MQFSTSYTLPVGKAHIIDWINDKECWQPAPDQSGNDQSETWVVINATDVIPLTDYPTGTKLFLRAEPLHPGAQPTLLDADEHRITAFLTNSPRWHGPFLDARHRAPGRCENRIKTLKNTGLGKLPFFDFAANQAWANIAALAFNLVSWIQLAALPGRPPRQKPGTSNAGGTGSSRPPGRSSPRPQTSPAAAGRSPGKIPHHSAAGKVSRISVPERPPTPRKGFSDI